MKRLSYLLAVSVLVVLQLGAFAEDKKEKKKPERYSAIVLGTGGRVGGRTVNMDFTIKEYTTDEQIKEYLTVLQEQGQDQLRRVLEKVEVGRIAPTGYVGTDIAIARLFETPEGKTIRIVVARPMSFLELYWGGRSTDYPFTIMELKLDKEGKSTGLGAVMGGTKVKIKDGQLELESYGNQYLKLSNVKEWK